MQQRKEPGEVVWSEEYVGLFAGQDTVLALWKVLIFWFGPFFPSVLALKYNNNKKERRKERKKGKFGADLFIFLYGRTGLSLNNSS